MAADPSASIGTAFSEYASLYASLGIPVFPLQSHGPGPSGRDCHRDCGRDAAKHPRTKHGLLDATTDGTIIRRWGSMWPHANIGGATGPAAGLFVVDVDPDKGGEQTLQALTDRHGPLPVTWRVRTPRGGRHLYFRYPSGLDIRNSASTVLGPGLDVRGVGGYVVLPPSIGANGQSYVWEVAPWK